MFLEATKQVIFSSRIWKKLNRPFTKLEEALRKVLPLTLPYLFSFFFFHSPISSPTSTPLFFLLPCFFDWMGDHMPLLMSYFTKWYYGSTHAIPWYLSSRRNLLCVLCNKASSLLRSDTQCFLLTLWFDIKHTHKNKQHK